MEVHLLLLCLASFSRVVWTEEAEPCDLNEEYLYCGSPCPLTCKNYQDTVFCNKQCTKGCFCKHGYVKGPDGKCILPQNCPIGPCLENEVASQCVSPCNDCFHRGKCLKEYCSHGCDCISGYFRNSTGLCVLASQCDVKESQCPIHEHFVSCVNLCNDCWSRGDCEQPYCQPGCDCLPGYFRNDEGDCIPEAQCIASVGCGLNEEYSDCVVPCNDCEHRGNCDHHCEYGCDCKSGYYRNKQGVCVPAAECSINAVEARGCRSCGHRCKDDEQFYICVPTCRTTCANVKTPEKQCSPFCTPGCFCKAGLVRNYDGHCIPPQECPEMCPLFEEYSDCGPACPATCSTLGHPVTCMQRCARGCFCINGYVRGPRGNCIKSEFCPNNCKANEEYKECGPSCPKSCGTSHTSAVAHCDSRCVKGCFCKDGYVRGPDGTCTLPEFCPVVCPENEVYQQCGRSCQVNCRNLATANAPCPQPCIRGCFCRRGYVRGPNGKCIPPERCPPVCKENEEFQECGRACQATCDKRNALNSPCPLSCIKGCFCKRGFVRGPGGTCILPNKCPVGCMENEEFRECGPACPEECQPRNNTRPCQGPCTRGCFCKTGFVRAQNGRCVRPQYCQGCKEDEIFRLCGSACPANCTNHNSEKECNNDCVPGCFCKDGLVRGPYGKCIPIRNCLPNCKENEVYQECGRPCQLTCDNITRSGAPCHLPCTKGCFCREGFVRDRDGRCIRPHQCPIICMENEEFKECGPACTANCTNRNPPRTCNLRCIRGCFCKDGLIRGPNGRCIAPVHCPERCGENEEFKECGSACPANCTNRISERVCILQCVRGCFCRDGFIRDPKGRCILPDRCPPIHDCKPNEVYQQCGSACPANCTNRDSEQKCALPCVPGCFCRNGFVRGPTGNCIPKEQCPETPCPKPNEKYLECGPACIRTCARIELRRNCPQICIRGCFCDPGFVRAVNGDCVRPQDCPREPQSCPDKEQFYACKPCPRTCDNLNSRRKCSDPCRPGCDCRRGFYRNRQGACGSPRSCRGLLHGRRGGNETEDTSELIFTDEPTELTTLLPPLSTASITNGETSRFSTSKPLDITPPIGSPTPLVILPRMLSSAPLEITTKTPSSIPLGTTPGIGRSTPLDTVPGIRSPKPLDTTPAIGSPTPLDTTLGIASPKPLDTTLGIASPKPLDTTLGIASPKPLDTTLGIGSPKPLDTTPGIGSSNPLDTKPDIGTSTQSSTIPSDILPRKLSTLNEQPDITSPVSSSTIDSLRVISSVVPPNIITTVSELLPTDVTSKNSLGPLETTPKVSSVPPDFISTVG